MQPADFDKHFVKVLGSLYGNRDAGYAVIMISMPLLERYLRQKVCIGTNSLADSFYNEFVRLFPSAKDVPTAKQLWAAYRHGFLHQGTMSTETSSGVSLPAAYLTHDMADAIAIRADGSFLLHPDLFSKRAVAEIVANFLVYRGTVAGAPPLPQVQRLDPVTIPAAYSGNRPP